MRAGLLTLLAMGACRPQDGPVVVLDVRVVSARDVEARGARLVPFDPSRETLADALDRAELEPRSSVILISDGNFPLDRVEDGLCVLLGNESTLTTVCLGSSPAMDAVLMSELAAWTGGKFIFTANRASLGKIVRNRGRAR